MAVRSVPMKRKLVQMVETHFPGFRFVSETHSICGFVREQPGYWYDYLPINRYFQGGRGVVSINWYWIGGGYVPDWYEWNGISNTPWRVLAWPAQRQPDPNEPPSQLAAPGHDATVCYQTGPLAQVDQALEALRDKLERYALPALERPIRPSDEPRLRQWGALAQNILPQLQLLERQAPEEYEALKAWQRQTARRQKKAIDEDVPLILARWREEIRQLPGFAEQWDLSPALRDQVFNWFTHALYLHP